MKSTQYNASYIKCQISFLSPPVIKLFLHIMHISESEGSSVGTLIRIISGTFSKYTYHNPHIKLEILRGVLCVF